MFAHEFGHNVELGSARRPLAMKVMTGWQAAVVLSAVLLAATVAGCGGASSNPPANHTHTSRAQSMPATSGQSTPATSGQTTPSVSVSPVATSPSASTGYASQYPSGSVSILTQGCEEDGNGAAVCACFAQRIVTTIPPSWMQAALPEIAVDDDPSWYSGAVAYCEGY
ncbi:MAG: hypothetical protein ACLP22_17880 [Solirubrobacteraceae bacterium]